MSHDPVEDSNNSSNLEFAAVLGARLTRRQALLGGARATTAALFGTTLLGGCDNNDDDGDSLPAAPRLGFEAVAKSTADRVSVPVGYKATVLLALGDPITAAIAAYKNDGSDGDFDQRIGDHGDALAFYPVPRGSDSSTDGLLVQNHEALTDAYLHTMGPTNIEGQRPLAEVVKEQQAHGVSVVRITKDAAGNWTPDLTAAVNTRWHVNSAMEIAGRAKGNALFTTKLSNDGIKSFGTLNNCGNGYTPWGTYLSGEENWFAYFVNDAASDSELLARYGIRSDNSQGFADKGGFNYRGWDTPDDAGDLQKRFNCSATGATAADDFRNEPNHFGWVVEIDPFDKSFVPRKRTELGRTSHEGAWFGPVTDGAPVVIYMGDDAQREYIYKFVSTANWDAADANKGASVGGKYLDEGTLYVARFNADGGGEWLPLTTANPALAAFSSLAEILVHTRVAADAAGATKMDRPEWGGVNPLNGEFYITLTNNSNRVIAPASAKEVAPDPANPRVYQDERINDAPAASGNANGHILRLSETGGDPGATSFQWDIYLFAARAGSAAGSINLSSLSEDNDFSSPDGLWFDPRGIAWIQTDDGAFTDVTNCMMLAAVPGDVGDGGKKTVVSTIDDQRATVDTFVGKPATDDLVRRFLVGPRECEITGVDMTPDRKSMFVNVQHPGERGTLTTFTSNWPSTTSKDAAVTGEANSRPRTATIVITRVDGGEIGV